MKKQKLKKQIASFSILTGIGISTGSSLLLAVAAAVLSFSITLPALLQNQAD